MERQISRKNVECIALLGNGRRGGAGSDWGTGLKQNNVGTNGRSLRWGLPFCLGSLFNGKISAEFHHYSQVAVIKGMSGSSYLVKISCP